jgi:hypothetical protein
VEGSKYFVFFVKGTPLAETLFGAVGSLPPFKYRSVLVGIQTQVNFIPFPHFRGIQITFKKDTANTGHLFIGSWSFVLVVTNEFTAKPRPKLVTRASVADYFLCHVYKD